MGKAKVTRPQSLANPLPAPRRRGESHLLIRDLVLACRIGVHQHERVANQRVRINLDLTIADSGPLDDDLDNVVCYSQLMTGIRRVVGAGHVNLVETLTERLAQMCLEDKRVEVARVRVEKLEVFPEAESVGYEIERRRDGG